MKRPNDDLSGGAEKPLPSFRDDRTKLANTQQLVKEQAGII